MQDKSKCILNNKISCKYSSLCSKTWDFVSKKDFIKYWKLLASLNYSNNNLMIFLLKNKKIPYIVDLNKSIKEILELKKTYISLLKERVYFKISYSKKWEYTLITSINKEDLFKSYNQLLSNIYPNCCTDEYYELNWTEWLLDIGFDEVYKHVLSKSIYICPLMAPNFFVKEADKTFSCFPYYQMCSFNCEKTKDYIENILSFLNQLDIDSEFFNFLKLPFLNIPWKRIFINWYYDKETLYYKGMYVFLNNRLYYTSKIKLDKDSIKFILVPWHIIGELKIKNLIFIW